MMQSISSDLKTAYAHVHLLTRDGYIGVVWYLITPLLLFGVFTTLNKSIPLSSSEQYPLYLFIGLIFFNMFRVMTNQAFGAKPLIKHKNKNIFEAVRIKTLHVAWLHLSELAVLIGFLLYFEITLLHLFLYLLFFLFVYCGLYPLCLLFAYVQNIFSNTRQLWAVCMRVLFIVTPIFYVLPQESLLSYNPLYLLITQVRSILIDGRLLGLHMYVLVGLLVILWSIVFLLIQQKKLR